MSVVQGADDRRRNVQRLIEGERAALALQHVHQVAAAQFHDQVVRVAFLPGVVKGENVRVIEAGERLGFAEEAAGRLGIAQILRQNRLDGDRAAEAGVARQVDGAHAALAQRGQHLVAPRDDEGDRAGVLRGILQPGEFLEVRSLLEARFPGRAL
ncbi:MAG: hypothetical protein NTZ05_03180, partial [Chloroflexi bacterium]|nr:hypothetical protein [Chloroflexota bacterium]